MRTAELEVAEQLARADYLSRVQARLRETRPELLEERRGRWAGPFADLNCPQGLRFNGPGLMLLLSPWDTSGALEEQWLHASVSRRDRCPSYDELTEVRDRFFRATDTVLHVWPPRTEHYSFHPYCLHLWTPLDGSRPIPDLRGRGGGV